MLKKISAALVAMLLIFSLAPISAVADTDGTPPKLISFSADKASYTLGDKITITIHATDDLSGVDDQACNVVLKLKDKGNSNFFCSHLTWVEGDEYFAQYDVSEDNIATGDYYIEKIFLRDNMENLDIDSYEYNNCPVQIHVDNPNFTDTDGPVLLSLTADKTEAAVGDKIEFTATAQDATGVNYIQIHFDSAEGKRLASIANLSLVSGSTNTLRDNVFTVESNMPDATYYAAEVDVYDTLGNVRTYSVYKYPQYSEPLPEAMQIRFKIDNPVHPSDEPTPALTAISYSTDTVKPGDSFQVNLTVNANGHTLNGASVGFYYDLDHYTYSLDFPLQRNSDGFYSGVCNIRPNMPLATLQLSYYSFSYDNGQYSATNYAFTGNPLHLPAIQLVSPYTGTGNVTVPLNQAFDPKAGVSVGNQTEGDLTGTLTVDGTVDTTKVGVYLLKYKAQSSQKSW